MGSTLWPSAGLRPRAWSAAALMMAGLPARSSLVEKLAMTVDVAAPVTANELTFAVILCFT